MTLRHPSEEFSVALCSVGVIAKAWARVRGVSQTRRGEDSAPGRPPCGPARRLAAPTMAATLTSGLVPGAGLGTADLMQALRYGSTGIPR
jgi:hypothetical protein